jgi:two-component system, cell cycle sensor histidine kinase and response regulator CckA
LSFSRKESQVRVPLEVNNILQEALKFLRATIPTTIEIKESYDIKNGIILADATQLHQVIVNLCTNAAHAMEEQGGILGITLSGQDFSENELNIEPSLKPGSYVRLCVNDTGTGIDQRHLDKIFDPYFTTKEVGKGSGMGLAVVVGIVKSHDGIITVDSKLGEGTTFIVYFPRIEEQSKEEVEVTAPLPVGNEKILVVDDEESIVYMTRRRLELLGYQVTAKTSSIEALELFRSQPDQFDLVITDQTMPGLTGEQLTKEVLRIRPGFPIILCTGYSSKIDAEKADFVGIRAFIMKPVERSELANTVRRILDTK